MSQENCALCGAFRRCASCGNADCQIDDPSGHLARNCIDNDHKSWRCLFSDECRLRTCWVLPTSGGRSHEDDPA